MNFKKEAVNVIDKIEVVISFYNHKPALILEFYNSEYDQLSLSGELQLAQKWVAKVKEIVAANRAGSGKGKKQGLTSHNEAKPVQREQTHAV